MAVKQVKLLSEVPTIASLDSKVMIPVTDANGNVSKVSVSTLQELILGGADLQNDINNGIFIMYHGSDGYPRLTRPHLWPAQQTAGEIASGVCIIEGGKVLVVAPTEADTPLYWSSKQVAGGGFTTTDREAAIADWTGKTSTAAQAEKPECNTAAYAPGFCNTYSRPNAAGKGLTAGKWWLPSVGEMMMIFANKTRINAALKLINGATLLQENWYWTSTESSIYLAWRFYLSSGYLNYNTSKYNYQVRVRPVSAFIL